VFKSRRWPFLGNGRQYQAEVGNVAFRYSAERFIIARQFNVALNPLYRLG
jgi:hypothetical protein